MMKWFAGTAVCMVTAWASAGPLNPPPGPVSPTGRFGPRIEINQENTPGDADSMFKITEPGSYYLASNVEGVAGRTGIEIDASFVTLDLSGYSVMGVAGATNAIECPAFTTIRNGSIHTWDGHGIECSSGPATIESIQVASTGVDGILVSSQAIVRTCQVQATCLAGGVAGINVGSSSVVIECTAVANAGGIRTGGQSVVSRCTALGNAAHGFQVGADSVVETCTSLTNGADGFNAGEGCTLALSTASHNIGDGVQGGTGCVVTDIASLSNAEDGFDITGASRVAGCSARLNGADGINIGAGSLVQDCSATTNTGDGIELNNDCLVRGNICDSNTGDGILATGSTNRIEANACTDNRWGIFIDGARCQIVGNFAATNAGDGILAIGNEASISGNSCMFNGDAGIEVLSADCRAFSNESSFNDEGISTFGADGVYWLNVAVGNSLNNYENFGFDGNRAAPQQAIDALAISPWANIDEP